MALLASALSGLPVQAALADPTGAPTYRSLAGVGSATTQDLMDALSDKITINGEKVLASYRAYPGAKRTITTKDPATHPDCTLNRPLSDAAGQGALGYSIGAADGCLDFARLGGEPSSLPTAPVPNVTYLPYALDGITFTTNRRVALLGKGLDYLRELYTCGPASTAFHPLLPASGSLVRSEWLAALDISEAEVSSGKYPCVKDTYEGTPIHENDAGPVAADPSAIMPVSISPFVTRKWPDLRMGHVVQMPETDTLGPVVDNYSAFPDGVSYATHYYSDLPDMTLTELRDLYQCRITDVRGLPATPLLPVAGQVRTAWLAKVGITEADLTANRYPCIRTTRTDGSPIQANDGQSLEIDGVIPYSIADYIGQMLGREGVAADKRSARVLGGLAQADGTVERPFILNQYYGRPLVRRLYNVIPVAKQRTSPWREVFTGPNSLICQNTGLIKTYGFTPLAPEACGGGATALADPAPPTYRIRNVKSGRCLTVSGTANAAPAVQRTCGSGTDQRWAWHGNSQRQLRNAGSGQCLAIGSGSVANGAQAVQWPCGSGAEQQWIMQAHPAGTESRLKNVNSSLMLSVSGGGSTADGAKLIQWPANTGPEQTWTLETATTITPGGITPTVAGPSSDAGATGPASPAPAGRAADAKAANEWFTVKYPERLVDIRHGRCRAQGYWNTAAHRPGSGPVGGMFLDTRAYVVGPKCVVSMHFQVVNYQMRAMTIFTTDHYYDASKPSGPGRNERWMFWGPILGGNYTVKAGNVVYLLTFSLKDLTAGNGLPSVGAIWGPKANWCDGWRGPGACPTTT
ncbi:RICIN domain-containing protein [Microtetraspora sp. NBRC 13810]|uniref:RICIN domain-containing protein n=1 Tax=Microtetraspora sp. NBRC 13810 TaxID=3030990 RepID=UPI002553BE28|nr:RICIN domain-containing protein [Microtetraspora sp. NBRC 13810]